MAQTLKEITRAFARGEATLEDLREAARKEPVDRLVADRLLKLIGDWERHGVAKTSPWYREELRDHAGQIVPPLEPQSDKPKDYAANMYETGLRGQRRQV